MPLEVVTEGAVSVIRMQWQERRNALRPENGDEIADAIRGLPDAGAIVLCGGPEAFCAGADLYRIRELAQGGEEVIRGTIYRSFQGLARAIRDFPGVVISAVDGPALGLGTDLALVCDVCYVGEGGWIDQGWGRIGAIPGIGGAWLTVRRAGLTAAWQFLLAQQRWTGPELERLGLAIAAPGRAEDQALDRARWIAGHAVDITRAYKSLLLRSLEESYEVHLERCASYQSLLVTSSEHAKQSMAVFEASRAQVSGAGS